MLSELLLLGSSLRGNTPVANTFLRPSFEARSVSLADARKEKG